MYLFPQVFLPLLTLGEQCASTLTNCQNLERYQKLGGFNHPAKTPTLNPSSSP